MQEITATKLRGSFFKKVSVIAGRITRRRGRRPSYLSRIGSGKSIRGLAPIPVRCASTIPIIPTIAAIPTVTTITAITIVATVAAITTVPTVAAITSIPGVSRVISGTISLQEPEDQDSQQEANE
jgi:hypothetical protein